MVMQSREVCAGAELQSAPSHGETVNTAKYVLNGILAYHTRIIKYADHRYDCSVA
jgi:hypothetical protein